MVFFFFFFCQVGGECEPRGMALNYLLAGWLVFQLTFYSFLPTVKFLSWSDKALLLLGSVTGPRLMSCDTFPFSSPPLPHQNNPI